VLVRIADDAMWYQVEAVVNGLGSLLTGVADLQVRTVDNHHHNTLAARSRWLTATWLFSVERCSRSKVVNLRDQISQTKLATDMIILFFDIGASAWPGRLLKSSA